MSAPDAAQELERGLQAAIATRGMLAALERVVAEQHRQRVRLALLQALACERATARALAQLPGVAEPVRLWALRHIGPR